MSRHCSVTSLSIICLTVDPNKSITMKKKLAVPGNHAMVRVIQAYLYSLLWGILSSCDESLAVDCCRDWNHSDMDCGDFFIISSVIFQWPENLITKMWINAFDYWYLNDSNKMRIWLIFAITSFNRIVVVRIKGLQ